VAVAVVLRFGVTELRVQQTLAHRTDQPLELMELPGVATVLVVPAVAVATQVVLAAQERTTHGAQVVKAVSQEGHSPPQLLRL
jgi:hypothetical protein